MALPAMADDTTGAPTSGSITINSPIVGATYKVYKIFDMTTNADVDAFSYTIDTDNDFYGAVVDYASTEANGLILSRIEGSSPATYNVSVDESKFDAQEFGKAMQAVLDEGSPEVTADQAYTDSEGTMGIAPKAAGGATIAENYSQDCTITDVNNSDQLVFDGTNHAGIPLGYYLINPTYPEAGAKTVIMGEGAAAENFTEEDVVRDTNGVATGLTTEADGRVHDYVDATVDSDYVDDYIEAHGITTNEDGSPLNDAGIAAIETALKISMKEDAVKKILAAFNSENGEEADINVKEPILVFLDSSQPDAVINEKNEINKWDVPVNPSGEAPEGIPDHGEPEGGKNIVVNEDPEYFADWSEAEIGESVHYQLRVNAMNFIRTGDSDDTVQQVKEYILADYQSAHMHFDEDKGLKVSIWQGSNSNDSQATTGDDAAVNVTKNVGIGTDSGITDASYTETGDGAPYLDYTEYSDTFFKNDDPNADGTLASLNGDIFGGGTGIVVPWVFVYDPATVEDDPATEDADESEDALNAMKAQYPIYTITNIPTGGYKTEALKYDENDDPIPFRIQDSVNTDTWAVVTGAFISENNHVVDAQGHVIDTDANGNLKKDENGAFVLVQETKPVYTFSIYNSDVTIVVDYWMILDDDAVVDEPGNKNFAQYGWNPIDNKDNQGNPKIPTNPTDDDEPSQKEKIDEATVYTFALAWVKIDEQGNELADAEFELPFYVKKQKDGNAYVYAFETLPETFAEGDSADNYTNKVTTTTAAADGEKGVITIKGVEQGTYTITETQAPAGYNKLTEPFTIEAKKSGVGVTTTTKTTIFLDAAGNVTDTVTNVTKEYKTDVDSYNNATPAVQGEETSVPVYQYKHITNKQGTELPSTGGIGTTIFYVVGAILVIGAGIILITRRRMDS